MGKIKRTSKITDNDKKLIKKLGILVRKESEFKEMLKEIEAEKTDLQEAISMSLKEGNYKSGSWVCIIKDKFTKGRKNLSWKTVATDSEKSLEHVKSEFNNKYPESSLVINKITKKLHKLYELSIFSNTTTGKDTTTTEITIEKIKEK